MPTPFDTGQQMKRAAAAQRDAEVIVDDLIGMFDRRQADRNQRAGITGQTVDSANLGPLYFYGGPSVDSGSGATPLEDTAGGQGGGSGPVMNTGTIQGVRIIAEVPPSLNALTVALLVNMDTVGTLSLDTGTADVYIPAVDAGLSVSGLNRGDRLNLDFTTTDGTVAGIHVVIDLLIDVQRGVG